MSATTRDPRIGFLVGAVSAALLLAAASVALSTTRAESGRFAALGGDDTFQPAHDTDTDLGPASPGPGWP